MKNEGLKIASLVLGIVGLALSFLFIGFLPAIIGLILGIISIKKEKNGMAIAGIICSIIGIIISVIVFINTPASSEKEYSVSADNTVVQDVENSETNTKVESSDLVDQMEVEEYSYSDDDMTYLMLVIKNNSEQTVKLETNATAKDSDGKTIGAFSNDAVAVMSGQSVALLHLFEDAPDVSDFSYTLMAKKDTDFESVFDDVTVEESATDDRVILTATNNGSKDAEYVCATALFFKDGKFVGFGDTYITDDDSYLKAGATLSSEIDCYADGGFDDVKVYYTGRR